MASEGFVPEVSVVVPTHDRRTLLLQTLSTVLTQRGVTLEVVVVDDGSTDGTADAVVGLTDQRIRLVRHAEAQGHSAARNSGIAAARGEWVAFVDDDDLWAPDKLAHQLQELTRSARSWGYTGRVYVDEDLTVLGGAPPPEPADVVQQLRRRNAVPAGNSSVAVRRADLQACGGFDTSYPASEDWDLWLRLTRRLGHPACVSQPLVGQRVHSGNITRRPTALLAGVDRIALEHRLPVDRGDVHRWLAEASLRGGDRRAAAAHWVMAVRHGCVRGVVQDVGAGFRRRAGRLRPEAAVPSEPSPWQTQADAWLAPLRVR